MRLKELEPYPAGCERTHPPQTNTLARVRGGFPEWFATAPKGGQEGQSVTGRKPGKDLVTTNQRPSNGGCWRVNSRSRTEKSHVGVQAVGENHREATHQTRQSFGGFVVHGVATHLVVPGRGCKIPSSLTPTHNPALNAVPFGHWTPLKRRPLALRYAARHLSFENLVMRSSSPVASTASHRQVQRRGFLVSIEMQAASPVLSSSAVAVVSRSLGFVPSVAVGSCRGAGFAAFSKRWVRGVPAFAPVPAPLPNMAVKRDWPSAASVWCCGSRASSHSLPCVAASPLLLR